MKSVFSCFLTSSHWTANREHLGHLRDLVSLKVIYEMITTVDTYIHITTMFAPMQEIKPIANFPNVIQRNQLIQTQKNANLPPRPLT